MKLFTPTPLTMGSIQQSSYEVGWPNTRGTNWIKYAYNCTQPLMKKAMRPTIAFANATSPQVFKSTNSLLNSTCNGCNVVDDDQASMHMGGVRASAIVFLPSHIALVKRLLMEACGEEGEFTSKMVVLGEEIMDLKCKVQDLVAQLHDKKFSLQKEEQKLVPLQKKGCSDWRNKLKRKK